MTDKEMKISRQINDIFSSSKSISDTLAEDLALKLAEPDTFMEAVDIALALVLRDDIIYKMEKIFRELNKCQFNRYFGAPEQNCPLNSLSSCRGAPISRAHCFFTISFIRKIYNLEERGG